ncbi:hypothetical protein [Nocardia transvalensis]|uniref:hypothetical protein n=1 Tax=Nocardia transvalensis TaxID=37333 RepID=UPI00189619FA|nr:hypothetical protein [Nocardia transvalensis]MBF6331629.1 hypothetical protein [Nocardia transvalensis]
MRRKILAGLPVGLLLSSAAVVLAAPAAQASAPTYTCTAKSWDGQTLNPVTVEAKRGVNQARMRARPEWRGEANFDTIVCTPNR